MKIIEILKKILKENSDPKNPESYPDHNKWRMNDWQTFYNALIKKWSNENEAKKQFLRFWEPITQSFLDEPSEDELDNESTGFKNWFRQRKMWNNKENRPYTEKEFQDFLTKQKSVEKTQLLVSEKLIEFVKKEEFFVPCVYDDKKSAACLRGEWEKCCLRGRKAIGIPTIGYGIVYYPDGKKVQVTDPNISKDNATEMLKTKLNSFAIKIQEKYPNLKQNQLDAMTSLCYNVGFAGCTAKAPNLTAALKKDPNPVTNPNIEINFLDFANIKRRKKEFEIYSNGNYT